MFLIETGASIVGRNRIMTGVKFLLWVTLRRHDMAAEIYHLKEPQRDPLVMSRDEITRRSSDAPELVDNCLARSAIDRDALAREHVRQGRAEE